MFSSVIHFKLMYFACIWGYMQVPFLSISYIHPTLLKIYPFTIEYMNNDKLHLYVAQHWSQIDSIILFFSCVTFKNVALVSLK